MSKLIEGDCLEVMKDIPDGSIDMVLVDPPYGTTACKWDSIIDLDLMWKQLKRVIKPNGAIVMMASQPFTTKLISSNYKMFKYCWVWEKEKSHTPLNAKHQPLKVHEDIIVYSLAASTFSRKGVMTYNPQMTKGSPYKSLPSKNKSGKHGFFHGNIDTKKGTTNTGSRYPRTVQKFQTDRGFHPTQKPVALMEYLIKTYTNEDETILDFSMGSGTTGVACKNLNRDFIGIELDPGYFKIAQERIDEEANL